MFSTIIITLLEYLGCYLRSYQMWIRVIKISTRFQEQDNTKKLKTDPTTTEKNKVYKVLFKYKDECTDDITRRKLTPHFSKPSHLYGLQKIHKGDMPLGPVVSSRNSFWQPLAKSLMKMIYPLRQHTKKHIILQESFVKNRFLTQIQWSASISRACLPMFLPTRHQKQ